MYCLIFNQLYAYNDLQISKVEFSYGGISKYLKKILKIFNPETNLSACNQKE